MNEFLLLAVIMIISPSVIGVFNYQVLVLRRLPLYLLSTRQNLNVSGDPSGVHSVNSILPLASARSQHKFFTLA